MSNSLYMHIVDGRPGMFDGDQIVIFNRYSSGITLKSVLKDSLKQIRDEQWKAIDWRKRRGYDTDPSEYDYIRIKKRDFKLSPEEDFKL